MIKKELQSADMPEPTITEAKEKLMSLKQYARLIGRTRETVYNMIKDKRVQVRDISGKKFIIIK